MCARAGVAKEDAPSSRTRETYVHHAKDGAISLMTNNRSGESMEDGDSQRVGAGGVERVARLASVDERHRRCASRSNRQLLHQVVGALASANELG